MSHSIINRLSPATVHKIAAGEVIERPANVVKELVENALDARARKITITIEAGGMELIRVADNGVGMVREDAGLAWLPHTTSKIREAGDLERISTYGFRGEALCSMAAVAELTIETRHASEATGTAVSVSGSREMETREITRNPGTTVTVKNLFLHSPVRRKFMGSGKNETSRILNMVGRIALANPGTAFRISEGGRELLSLGEGSLKNRTGEILGFNITGDLVPVEWTDGVFHVEGFVSTPQQARVRATHQYYFINGRSIQSALVARALAQSYDVLPPGRFPMAVLFLTLPPEEVDVNVHPTKKEVRFLNESKIYWAVSQAVKTALRKVLDGPTLDLEPAPALHPRTGIVSSAPAVSGDSAGLAPAFAYREAAQASGRVAEAGAEPEAPEEDPAASPKPTLQNQIRLFPGEARPAPEATSPFSGDAAPVPYLQLHSGFILFGVQSGLMIMNQQAAHERILYEKALEEMRQPGRFSSQQLLFPEVLEFSPAESHFLEDRIKHLQSLGFDLEAFGGSTFQLRGLPAEVRPDQARRVMDDLVEGLMRPERVPGSPGGRDEDFMQKLARVYARVTGIKLGDPLDYPQVSALVDGLFATQNPYVSPSGSPIVIRYSMEEIHSKFGLKP